MARVYRLTLKKTAFRKLHDTTVKEHADKFLTRLLTDGRVKRGWKGHVDDPVVEEGKVVNVTKAEDGSDVTEEKVQLTYRLNYFVMCKSKRGRLDEIVEKEVGEIGAVLARTSKAKGWEPDGDWAKMPEDFSYPGVIEEDPVEEDVVEEVKEEEKKEEVVEDAAKAVEEAVASV